MRIAQVLAVQGGGGGQIQDICWHPHSSVFWDRTKENIPPVSLFKIEERFSRNLPASFWVLICVNGIFNLALHQSTGRGMRPWCLTQMEKNHSELQKGQTLQEHLATWKTENKFEDLWSSAQNKKVGPLAWKFLKIWRGRQSIKPSVGSCAWVAGLLMKPALSVSKEAAVECQPVFISCKLCSERICVVLEATSRFSDHWVLA